MFQKENDYLMYWKWFSNNPSTWTLQQQKIEDHERALLQNILKFFNNSLQSFEEYGVWIKINHSLQEYYLLVLLPTGQLKLLLTVGLSTT